MAMGAQQVWEHLAAARYALLDLAEFEQWIYNDGHLESVLGADRYLKLVSFPFKQPRAQHELTRVIDMVYDEMRRTSLRRDMAAWLARGFLDKNYDLVTTARLFARLWSAGEDWVPSEFAYIDSELDSVPMPAEYERWDKAALAARLEKVTPLIESFQRAAEEASRQVLEKLDADAAAI